MARRDDVVAWKLFFVSAFPQHYYHSMSVIHKKKILFRSIVFQIKNFNKYVDDTPHVRLNIC